MEVRGNQELLLSIGLASKVSETDHRVETQELCVGDTCVTPKQFKTVFGIQSAVAVVRTVGAPRRRAAHPGQQEAWTPLPHRPTAGQPHDEYPTQPSEFGKISDRVSPGTHAAAPGLISAVSRPFGTLFGILVMKC